MDNSAKFWLTVNVLVGKDTRRTNKDIMDDVQDWLEKVNYKKYQCIENNYVEFDKKLEESKSFSNTWEISEKDIRDFFRSVNLPVVECKFSDPYVRARLEKLMGSNLVSLTDREYMQKLQERILEDYAECMDKRIKTRENKEMERVKNLVLTGKIPLSEAPEEMANHPIMLIEKHCNVLIAQRRAKIKIPKVRIPTHLYSDDTPDPPSGLTIEKGHIFRTKEESLCSPPSRFLPKPCHHEEIEDENVKVEEDVDGYMYTEEEYERLKYESPLVKELRRCQTIEEMYMLADAIIGVLKTIETHTETIPSSTSTVAPPPPPSLPQSPAPEASMAGDVVTTPAVAAAKPASQPLPQVMVGSAVRPPAAQPLPPPEPEPSVGKASAKSAGKSSAKASKASAKAPKDTKEPKMVGGRLWGAPTGDISLASSVASKSTTAESRKSKMSSKSTVNH